MHVGEMKIFQWFTTVIYIQTDFGNLCSFNNNLRLSDAD